MADLDAIRRAFPDLDRYGYNDAEVVNWLAERTNRDSRELGVFFGVVKEGQGDFSRGIGAAVDSTQALGYGLLGMAGAATGIDRVRDAGIRGYQRNMAEVSVNAKPTDRVEGVNSVGQAVDFGQYWLGYAVPQAAEAVVTGGIGAQIGKQVVRGAAREVIETGAETAATDLVSRAATRGALTAMGTQAVGTETGAIYGDAAQRAIDEGRPLDSVDLGRAAASGVAAGALEFGADVATLGLARLGPGKQLFDMLDSSRRAVQIPARGLAGAVTEGATEVLQTGIEDFGAGTPLSDANFSDPTSFFAGAVGGGAMGAVGGALAPRQTQPTETGTKLDAEIANENAQLQAQQAQQEQAQAYEADRAAREARLDYAPTFVSEGDFASQREAALKADAANSETEVGRAFRDYLINEDIIPTNEQERTTALNAFAKSTLSAQETDATRIEYRAALDEHISRMRDLETLLTVEPNAEQQSEIAPEVPNVEIAATDAPPTEAAPIAANQDAQAETGLATAEQPATKAPDPTQLATELVRATGVAVDDRVATDISTRMAQIVAMPTAERVAATRALVANYTTPQKKATGRTPAAQKPAPQPQVARVPDPITMETPVRHARGAQAKADALLPANWTEDARYDDVNSALNGKNFNIKKFNTALEAALNPQEETQADPQAETPTNASGESVPAPQSVPTTFVDDPELRTTLSNQQASVYDAMLAAANEGRLSDIFTVSWSAPTEQDGSNYMRRKAEQKRGRTKVLKDAGVTDKALLRRLFPEKPTPTNPEPPLSQKVRMLREAGVGENIVELFQKVTLPERVEEKDSSAGWQVEADTKKLAAAAGIKNPGSAKTQISAVMRKVRERYGDEGFRRMLADTGALGEGSGLGDTTSMAEAVEAGLVTAQTTGQSQTGGASAKGKVQATGDERQRLKATGVKQSEIDKWFEAGNAAAAENDQTQVLLDEAQQNEDFAVKQADRMLRAKWAESNPTDIAYDDLSAADKRAWMKAVYENIGVPTTAALESLQETAQGIAGSISPKEEAAINEGQKQQSDQGGRAKVRAADGNQGDTNLSQNDGGGRTADSGPADSGGQNGPETRAARGEAGRADTGVVGRAVVTSSTSGGVKVNVFSGVARLLHGYSGRDQVNFETSIPNGVEPYDGGSSVYGTDGVYLDGDGKWTANDPDAMVFSVERVAEVDVPFTNALVFSPETAPAITARAKSGDADVATGVEVARWAKKNGHDGLIVTGFDQLVAEATSGDRSTWEAADAAVTAVGLEADGGQDQVIAFNPKSLTVVRDGLPTKTPLKPIAEVLANATQADTGVVGDAASLPKIQDAKPVSVGPTTIIPKPIAAGKPLYRETSPAGLRSLLNDDAGPGYLKVFVADNLDLALGQGTNTGVKVTFRPDSLGGEVNRKPSDGLGVGQEYVTTMTAGKAIATIEMPTADIKNVAPVARRTLAREFDAVEQGKTTTFTRKELSVVSDGITQPDTGVIGQARSAPVVEVKKARKKINPPDGTKRFSRVTGSNVKRTSKDRITKLLKQTFNPSVTPDNLYSRIQVFSTVDEAAKALSGMFTREELSTTQAVVSPDGSRVFVVAENIPEGQELSVILHDLGVHVGLEGLLGGGNFDSLVTAVRSWEDAPADTVERQVWEAATARVAFARTLAPMDEDLAGVELVGYAAEEAARLGVTPTAEEQNTVAKWLHDVGEFVGKVLQRALGFSGEEFQLTAGELVAFAFGAAEQAMNQAVVETGAVSDATYEQIAAYYSGLNSESELTGTEELFVADPSQYSNGEELFVWGDGSTFGEFTDIITDGELFTEFDGRKSLQLYLTSAESRAEAEKVTDPENGSDFDALLVVTASQTIEHPNVWDLSIFGPDTGTAAFEVARKRGVVSRTRGTDGDTWSRLEGIPRRDTMRVLAEARRRLTRMQEGLVPNIVFTRATGIAALVTQDGRVGFVRDADVRKRFSRVSPAQQGADQESQVANPQGAQQNASRTEQFLNNTFGGARSAQIIADAKNIFRKPLDATKFLHQFIDENREAMPSAGQWMDGMLAQEQTTNEILARGEPILSAYRELTAERQALLNDFIGSSTFYQKWGYDPKWPNKKVKVDPVMETKFKRLTAAEQQIARDIFQHGEDMRTEINDVLKKMGVNPDKFTLNSKLDGPYAPLKRFGNYVATLRSQELADLESSLRQNPQDKALAKKIEKMKSDGAHYIVSFFDTPGSAEKFAFENQRSYPVNEVSERMPDAFGERITNPEAFSKVISALKADEKSGLDSETRRSVVGIVERIYYDSLGERNARLSGARRLNRAGYEKDMVRSFMSHLQAQARLVAQLKHGAEINTAFANVNKEAAKDGRRLRPVAAMIARKYNGVLTKKNSVLNSVQDNIAAFNTVYMLTSNIGYHVANATQPMISVAKLAGDFGGYTAAWGALVRGYKNSRSVVNSSMFRQVASALTVGFVDMNNKVEIDLAKAPPKYRELLKTLQLRQLLDVGMEEDLNLENRFNTGYEVVNKASEGFSNMTHRLYQVARFVEAHNRVSTALAAYDMAQANPAALKRMKMTPQEYAISVVQDTQGNFSRLDAPLLIDALPKLTTQFRKFQIMMAWLYGNAFKKAFRGADAYEKAAGRRTLGYLVSHAALMSGATGIPFASSIVPYVLAFSNDGDEPQDFERYIREELFPDDDRMADLVSRGVPAFFGIDMSAKLTQSDIFSPVNLKYVDSDFTAQGARNVLVQTVFGPTAGNFSNLWRGIGHLAEGDVLRGTEFLTPRGIRSIVETGRFASEGVSLSNGSVVIDPRDVDISSLMLNAIGLPPEELTQLRWTYGQQYELKQWFSNESGRLREAYVEANSERDRDEMARIRDAWRELQAAKDRVRPFFNNSKDAPQQQSVSDLLRAPREAARKDQRYRESLGTE